VYVRVCFGYDGGVPTPGNGEMRPRFGQLYSYTVRNVPVLQLWPLDFAMNTRASTTTKPLATLWRPTLSSVHVTEIAFSGFERAEIAGRRRWLIQRWQCEPTNYQDAKRSEAKCKAETWRWV
jgi:hypothetical protein